MKIVCIGHAAYDIVIPMEGYPIENTKNRLNSKIEGGGGPAATAAYLLGKWGCDVSFLGVVGSDQYGNYIKKELEQVNVDTTYLELNEEYNTTCSYIIANKLNGSRTVLTPKENDIKMNKINLNFEPDIILMDGQEYDMSVSLLEKYPKAISVIDAGRATKEIIDLCKKVNYVVCSKKFAEEVTNIKIDYENNETLKQIFIKLKEMFKNEIVITLESKGCLYEHDNEIKLMSSIKVTAIDSTGAGDIFHGAFVYGLSLNLPYEQILKLANVTAGLSVTSIGSRNSIFDLNEIKEKYEEFK